MYVLSPTIHLEAEVEWRNPPPIEDWEVYLAVHDPATSDVRALVSQRGVSGWIPQKVSLPVVGRFPIQAGRAYAVRFEIDTVAARYAVSVDGVPLATGVSLDRILVMPGRVLRSNTSHPYQRIARAGR